MFGGYGGYGGYGGGGFGSEFASDAFINATVPGGVNSTYIRVSFFLFHFILFLI